MRIRWGVFSLCYITCVLACSSKHRREGRCEQWTVNSILLVLYLVKSVKLLVVFIGSEDYVVNSCQSVRQSRLGHIGRVKWGGICSWWGWPDWPGQVVETAGLAAILTNHHWRLTDWLHGETGWTNVFLLAGPVSVSVEPGQSRQPPAHLARLQGLFCKTRWKSVVSENWEVWAVLLLWLPSSPVLGLAWPTAGRQVQFCQK